MTVQPKSNRETQQVAETANAHSAARREWFVIGLLLLFGLAAISPLLQPGYFWGAHDARHDVYFIFQYGLSFKEGILWPRWSPDWAYGYGYPFFTIYAPLATFIGVLFNQVIGLGYEASVKAVLALSMIGSGLAMYGFVRSFLGRRSGLVAPVAYMMVPYHLVNVFVRAAMAECFALVAAAVLGLSRAVCRPARIRIAAGLAFGAPCDHQPCWPLGSRRRGSLFVAAILSRRCAGAERVCRSPCARCGRVRPCARSSPLGWPWRWAWPYAAFFVPALIEQGYITDPVVGEYYNPAQHLLLHQLFVPRGFGSASPPDDAAQAAELSAAWEPRLRARQPGAQQPLDPRLRGEFTLLAPGCW